MPSPLTPQSVIDAIHRDQGIVISPFYDQALDRPLTEREAALHCGLTYRTLQMLRQTGSGPAFIKLTAGPRGRIGYTLRSIILWRQARLRRSTSERGG